MAEYALLALCLACWFAAFVMWRLWAAPSKRHPAEREPAAVPAPLREELDQTTEWWDREFDRLLKLRIPRDASAHAGHRIEGGLQFWGGGYATGPVCLDCRVTLDRPPDG